MAEYHYWCQSELRSSTGFLMAAIFTIAARRWLADPWPEWWWRPPIRRAHTISGHRSSFVYCRYRQVTAAVWEPSLWANEYQRAVWPYEEAWLWYCLAVSLSRSNKALERLVRHIAAVASATMSSFVATTSNHSFPSAPALMEWCWRPITGRFSHSHDVLLLLYLRVNSCRSRDILSAVC